MGVSIYLLDRRTAALVIGGTRHTVGTLRRFFKVTELNEGRSAELDAAEKIKPSPRAVILPDGAEMPIAAEPSRTVPAHVVLGWDDGRGRVTDFGWDYLPCLGYAVRETGGAGYVLHEERDGGLVPVSAGRARETGLVDLDGRLLPHGQPRITECRSVRPYIDGYAEADCVLERGGADRLLVRVTAGDLPEAAWFVGKRPMDVARYPEAAG